MKPRPNKLGACLRAYRLLNELEMRTLGAEVGVSASTICRLEMGHAPDAHSLLKLLTWMLSARIQRSKEIRVRGTA